MLTTRDRIFGWLAIACLALLMGGCSIKTAYKQLDWVLAGLIDDYVSLSSEQEKFADQRIASLLKWHQHSELKIYADDLQKVEEYTTLGLDDASAEDIFNRFLQSWERLKARVAPEMAELLLQLNGKQINELFENLNEKNQELLEEYQDIDQDERYEEAGDKLIENFERWLGDLNEQQKALLRTWPAKFKPVHEERMAFRKKWQARLLEILIEPTTRDAKYTQLLRLIKEPADLQTEEHKQKIVYNSKLFKTLTLEFDHTVTQTQRGFLAGRLEYFIENFRELAAEKEEKS